eukprot:CAMPEP_0116850484 /NCGR_PEP_ID=MMETSP0418-20121206/16180_1 /TAXON_ID=1158023 /ORGANISM="Astrosyne radiata, Strain 13vi08-1A" /LENGTH=250 /DNA_ID=CAMNT_0004482375 /DNA_START=211 /DNA_END=963 /DNA_ORIENTATION=-
MRRGKVKAVDVIWPLVALTATNLIVLATWNIMDPWVWKRVPEKGNVDRFGRAMSSYATCDSEGVLAPYFLAVLGLVNFLAVLMACYQSYLTRKMPSEFSESFYLALTVASIAETFVLGLPILLITRENRTTNFVVITLLVVLVCLAVLLPAVLSKVLILQQSKRTTMGDDWRSVMTGRKRGLKNSVTNLMATLKKPVVAEGVKTNRVSDSTLSIGTGLPSSVAALRASVLHKSEMVPSNINNSRSVVVSL